MLKKKKKFTVVTIICGEWVSEEQERGNNKVGRPVLLQMRRKEMDTTSSQRKDLEGTAYSNFGIE